MYECNLNQYLSFNKVVLINNSSRNLHLNTSNLLLSPQNSIISSLSQLHNQKKCNSFSNSSRNYLFSQEFITRKFYSTLNDDDKEENDQNINSNDNDTYINNDATRSKFNNAENSFYKENASGSVDNKNNDTFSTFNTNENLEKLSSASPYLLWTSFILASSISACLFKQLTGSSIISHVIMIGIDFPAIVNASHLYNQGGKMIAKELGAEQCPSTSELCGIVEEVAKQIKLNNIPDVYIHESEEINALTAGIKDDNSIILITKGLLNNLKPEEIRAIIAHMLYHKKANFTSLGTHLTAMVSGFYAPYNIGRYIRNYLIECKKKKENSLLLDIAMGLNSIFIFMTKLLNCFCYISQSAFVRFRERTSLPKELMTDAWKSAIRKLYNQPASVMNEQSLINSNPAFTHLFLCDGKGEGWNKAASMAGNFDKDIQNGKLWTKKNVRTVTEYFSIFPSLKKRIEWTADEVIEENKNEEIQ
ncbi:hypothetical protein LY90DRAFT_668175 [Neocallimastix californiae]|uniref:Peptidase M48 domain-containing protein n=1 Tax=Neocallimastix californiae TaxID=1754190 RepID=A0A1Y2DWN9_9FUNG|nr:hypothetical protein LY90DRAFT_668175 [Neocallimastix californiae]|eukprot:ORY63698.1 hypothetical protein LY90DRAFT_668175 [Neocallimastix californiae]